jgi:hypothetical protein
MCSPDGSLYAIVLSRKDPKIYDSLFITMLSREDPKIQMIH